MESKGQVSEIGKDQFRVLVEQYSRPLFGLAFRMTGNENDAEDIVQETFLRAWRNLANYDGRASFSTWLYRIAANCALDMLRARRRRGPAADLDDHPDLATGAPGPDAEAFGGQIHDRLHEAMRELSAQERTAFVLRHHEELSIDEISSTLGVSREAAKHSVFRAVQKLRRAMAPVMG